MSNPQKHKPLSAQELFALLHKNSKSEINTPELDEFEKDALEGFSAHSNAVKAQKLTDEINLAISKKLNTKETNKSNKVAWYAAAVSIAVLIIVSTFYFNQSKESTANIALNEIKNEKDVEVQTPMQSLVEEAPNDLQSESVISEKLNTSEQKKANNESLNLQKPSSANMAGASQSSILLNNPKILKNEVADDVANESIESKAIAEQQIAPSAKYDSRLLTAEAEVAENDKLVIESAQQAKAKKMEIGTSDNMAAQTKNVARKENSVAAAPAVANSAVADSKANYPNGNKAISDFVKKYYNDKSIAISFCSNYLVKGTVNDKGEFSTKAVMQISRELCNNVNEKEIEKALNSMVDWTPAYEKGKPVSSDVEFKLSF